MTMQKSKMNWDEYFGKFEKVGEEGETYVNNSWVWTVIYDIQEEGVVIQISDPAFGSIIYSSKKKDSADIRTHIINAIDDVSQYEKMFIKQYKKEQGRHVWNWLFRQHSI